MNRRIFRFFCVVMILLCTTTQPLTAQIASLSGPASEAGFLPGDFDNASTSNPLIGSFSSFPPVLPISEPEENFSEGPFSSFAGISAAVTSLVWTPKAPMPVGRWWPGVAAAPNGKVYAMGGVIFASVNVPWVDEYDPISNTWATRSPMPWAHHVWPVTAHNGKIYSVGGTTNGFDWYNRVDEYNPGNDTWTTKNPMPTARYCPGLAIANNGKIYAIGGNVSHGTIQPGRWRSMTRTPTPGR